VKLLVDEDSQSKRLLALLREYGHDVVSASEMGLNGLPDRQVLLAAFEAGRVLLTRNPQDFLDLHEQEVEHAGILIVNQDRVQSKNMNRDDIARAIHNLESTEWPLDRQLVRLNDWQFEPSNRP
jgi:hypothetical protein